jgi:ribosomal protein L17
MQFLSLAVFAFSITTLVSCGGSKSSYPHSDEGVKQIATVFMKGGSDADALLKNMKPSLEDCKLIVTSEVDAKKLADMAEQMYAQVKAADIAPSKASQTDVLVFHSTTAALKTGADQELPGGYTEKASKFKDGLDIYGFKFVEPNEKLGMAFDGLYFVNNKWVFFPKAWKYLD